VSLSCHYGHRPHRHNARAPDARTFCAERSSQISNWTTFHLPSSLLQCGHRQGLLRCSRANPGCMRVHPCPALDSAPRLTLVLPCHLHAQCRCSPSSPGGAAHKPPDKPWYVPTHRLESTTDTCPTSVEHPQLSPAPPGQAPHQHQLTAAHAPPTPTPSPCAASTSTTYPSPLYATLNTPPCKSRSATTRPAQPLTNTTSTLRRCTSLPTSRGVTSNSPPHYPQCQHQHPRPSAPTLNTPPCKSRSATTRPAQPLTNTTSTSCCRTSLPTSRSVTSNSPPHYPQRQHQHPRPSAPALNTPPCKSHSATTRPAQPLTDTTSTPHRRTSLPTSRSVTSNSPPHYPQRQHQHPRPSAPALNTPPCKSHSATTRPAQPLTDTTSTPHRRTSLPTSRGVTSNSPLHYPQRQHQHPRPSTLPSTPCHVSPMGRPCSRACPTSGSSSSGTASTRVSSTRQAIVACTPPHTRLWCVLLMLCQPGMSPDKRDRCSHVRPAPRCCTRVCPSRRQQAMYCSIVTSNLKCIVCNVLTCPCSNNQPSLITTPSESLNQCCAHQTYPNSGCTPPKKKVAKVLTEGKSCLLRVKVIY
jgi:hypothetical protein